ncbi:energy transducer TonB [Thermomonas haemolytica]|uniref:Protein TonB n=1 Tax=Thermomonas haemolytica TaxID=141949 RepID=A0A4V2V2C8_9GAMM|nr:energy transducer TonB [Thermomonas haemolytica]TCT24542.1 outer membrane transport energization protein TonB [Thermomonas haemolytica]
MTEPALPPKRASLLSPTLPKLVALAFAAGLLLFLLVWLGSRQPNDFYKAGDTPANATPPEALPAPLPPDLADGDGNASGNVSGLRVDPNAQAAPPPPAPARPAAPVANAATGNPATAPTAPAATGGNGGSQAQPTPLSTPAPRYPPEALRMGIGGTVKVRVVVTPDGRVDRLELAETSGNRYLDRAALETVRRWTFRPAMRNGQPVQAEVVVPIQFDPNR